MIKAATLLLTISLLLWVFFYLPKRLRKGAGARLRYIVFSVLAVAFALVLAKTFL